MNGTIDFNVLLLTSKYFFIGSFIHKLKAGHGKRPSKALSETSQLKPVLNSLLSESLLKTMRNKLQHMSKNAAESKDSKESKESELSDKAYSTIGNEGPTTAAEETGHRRSTKEKKKAAEKKHKKENEEMDEEREVNSTEKAEIAAFHEKDFDEDEVSKKDKVRHH